MHTSLSELRKHFKVKKELETYGLSRSFMVRYKGWIITGFIIGVALIAGVISPDLSSHLSGPEVVTAIIAIGALVLGYQQWQAARHEVSLDKFYERLQFINQKLYEWPSARKLLGNVPRIGETQNYDEDILHERALYTYLELDNLEYAVEKYKLGYMSAGQALRCLKTFQVRCKSPDFLELALHCATINEGYTSDMIEVVKRIYNQQVTTVRNTESLQDAEENSGR